VYIIWYPLLRRPKEKGVSVRDTLFGVTQGKRCRLELYTASEENKTAHTDAAQHSPRGMYGSGLVIINPPWTLRSALEDTMPWFAEILGGESGGWKLEWEA
ncbi:MAG: 23S rRNA (adenine(2030)-N(6))-methyltransferase RlmJ, partial [Treponema sp.]|nr:23S rRNA (adenine(2030)-N(6))-methyltransferase RlmJ [Treponema sp.]